MNTIRTGKIARLPKSIRDELNTRIDRAESGPTLAAWLNTLPDVQTVLTKHFANRPINLQNISEWRNGGYQDYLQVQADYLLTRDLAEHSDAMENIGKEIPDANVISDAFMTVTAADFVRTARVLLKETRTVKERWAVLCDINTQFTRLRREDCRIGHLKIRQDKSDAAKAAAAKAAEAEQRRHYLTYFELQPHLMELGKKFCGNEKAYERETFILELKHNLPVNFLDEKPPTLYKNPPAAASIDPSNPSDNSNPTPIQPSVISNSHNSHSSYPAHVDTPETSATILNSKHAKPSKSSPGGEDLGEGELSLSEAANILHSPRTQTPDTRPDPTPESIKPQTALKTPDIRVHQTPAESFENPRQTPDSSGPGSRPTCQSAIGDSSNSQPEAPAYPESLPQPSINPPILPHPPSCILSTFP